MAVTLQATILPDLRTLYRSGLDLSTAADDLLIDTASVLTSGTTANKADLQFHDQRTIAASGNDDMDLAGGLSDAFGTTLTFVEIVSLLIKAASGNTNNLDVGGGSNPFLTHLGASGDIVTIRPGGFLWLFAPTNPAYTVTAGTGDILRVTNDAGSTTVTYDIVILGRSA